MLFLLFQVGKERYALEAGNVVEVIPMLAIRRLPQSPRGVAGFFVYRGQPVPAVDLGELLFSQPARLRLSTRIIVADCSADVVAAHDSVTEAAHGRPTEHPPESRAHVQPPAHAAHPPGGQRLLLGLIAEHATDTLRRDSKELMEVGVNLAATSCLGPMMQDEKGLIQLIYAKKLLADNIGELLLASADAAFGLQPAVTTVVQKG